MSNPANFPSPYQAHPTLAHTADIIDAEAVELDSEAVVIVKQIPDGAAITQDFLVYYQSFVGSSIDHPLVWRTQAFGSEETDSLWLQSWVKASVVGIGGLATVAAAGTLLSKNTMQNVAQATQKLTFSSSVHREQSAKRSFHIPANNSIASGVTRPEFSSSSEVLRSPIPKLRVSPVISSAIRAPLPGQVISQQRVAQIPEAWRSLSSPLKKLKAPKPASSKPRAISYPTAEKLASRSASLPSLAAAAPPFLSSNLNAAPSQLNGIRGQLGSTPMPPNQSPETTLSLNPAQIAPPTASSSMGAVVPEQSKRLAPEPKRQNVILGNLSQLLNQEIDKAQTIQDFLTLSQQLPQSTQVAIVSLTAQAAIAVPNGEKFDQFQVFRFPESTYQKAWLALTQAAGKTLSAPAYGFIDYQQRAIVLPLMD